MKVGDGEEITYETASTTLKRAVNIFTALQSEHGHWPAEIAGPQFFLPPLVSPIPYLFFRVLQYISYQCNKTNNNMHVTCTCEMLYMQVFCLYITGDLNSVFGPEHRREILRSIYYHQVRYNNDFS